MKSLLAISLLLPLIACQPSAPSSSGEVNTAEARKGSWRKNSPPSINAGADFSVVDSDGNGSQSVQLKVAVSDIDENIQTYRIYRGGSPLVSSSDPLIFSQPLVLSIGSHQIIVEAVDAHGETARDSVNITVEKAPVAANTAPVVNAGPDFSITDTDNNGSQMLKLQGSATDAENNIVKYLVHKNGATYAGGTVPYIFTQDITLPVGSHTMTFEATDAAGLVGSDTVVITVKAPVIANTAPKVSAGPDLSIVDSDGDGTVSVKLAGSASDAENNITYYRVFRNGTFILSGGHVSTLASTISLPLGTHTIKMDAKDAAGLMGEDSMIVNVTAAPNTAPTVKAGADVALTDSDNSGSEMITLAGSASDAQNNMTSFRVLRNGTQILSGSSASIFTQSISVPVGSHTIVMEATDAMGLKGSDSLMVNIAAAPTTPPPSGNNPPIANAGPDIKMENTDYGLSVAKIKLYGSATAGSNPIVRYVWKVNGIRVLSDSSPVILTGQEVFFIKGNNLLTLEVTDSAGLKGVDQAIVEVKPSLMDKPYGNSTVAGLYSISTGGQRIAIDHDGNGFETVRMVGSITSVNPIVSYKWLWRGQVMASGTTPDVLTTNITMPIGQFNLKLEAVDSAGNVMSDGFNLQVTAPVREQVARIPSNFNTSDYLVNSWYSGPSHWKDNSAFRFNCKASHYLYDDPIVFPGQPGKAHLHMFFGNTLANANSTYESLRKTGDGSCDGGPLNRSSYWMPALLNENGKVVVPDHLTIYYKKHPGTNRLPRGLRMIFGYNHATGIGGNHWKCSSGGGNFKTIAEVDCPATVNGQNSLMVTIATPKCWDGVNLDSPDHRSHMAYPKYNNYGEATCPATHPVTIPVFTMLVSWSHTGHAEYSKWRLASDHTSPHDSSSTPLPGGTSMHSDWFGAWDDEVMDKWHEGCMDGFKSCSGGALGTGKQLKRAADFSWTTTPRLIDPPVKPISP